MRRRRRVFRFDDPGVLGAALDENDEAELGRALPKELKEEIEDPARGEELREEENGWGSMVRVTGFALKVTLREGFGRAVSGLALSCLNKGARSEVELAGVVGLSGCCGDEAIVRSSDRISKDKQDKYHCVAAGAQTLLSKVIQVDKPSQDR